MGIFPMCTFSVWQLPTPARSLLYHTPDLHSYDVKRAVTGWDVSHREIVLDKEVKHKTSGSITHEKIMARIGTEPLELKPTD